jgi:hypothetical protein
MNAPEIRTIPLPRYGIREDEMTRPGVVLFDWNDDDAPVRVNIAPDAEDDATQTEEDDDEELRVSLFGRRFRGVGRRPGAVALGLVLGVSAAIGVCATFATGDAQATASAR